MFAQHCVTRHHGLPSKKRTVTANTAPNTTPMLLSLLLLLPLPLDGGFGDDVVGLLLTVGLGLVGEVVVVTAESRGVEVGRTWGAKIVVVVVVCGGMDVTLSMTGVDDASIDVPGSRNMQ